MIQFWILGQLDERLENFSMPKAKDLLGKKFRFISSEDRYFLTRIVLDTVASVVYKTADDTIRIIPTVRDDGSAYTIKYVELKVRLAEEDCNAMLLLEGDASQGEGPQRLFGSIEFF
jgi:hypothetical protein